MRLNAAGDAVTGFSTIGVNGSTPAALVGIVGGGVSWLTATKILYQSGGVGGGGPWILQSYDTGTTALATVDPHPANYQVGGNNIWAAFLASSPSAVRTSVGGLGPFSGAALGDVSPTGQIVKIDNYQVGQGVTVYNSAGVTTYTDPNALLTIPLIRTRNNLVVYHKSNDWIVIGTSGAAQTYQVQVDPINWMVPVVSDGNTLLLERSERLMLRYAKTGQGWVIWDQPNTFSPDCVEVSPGVIRIGWCLNQGETPESLMLADLTISTNTMRVGTVSGGAIVWGAPAVNPRVSFDVVPSGTATGLKHPKWSQPFTDTKTGEVTKPWQYWIENQTDATNGNTDAIDAIPASNLPPGFSTVASTGQPPINANDAVLNVEAGPGIAIQLIPPTQTLKISVVPGTSPPNVSFIESGSSVESYPIPGPMGPQGPMGPMGPPAFDAETPEPQILLIGSQTTVTAALIESLGYWSPLTNGDAANPELIFADGDTIACWTPTS